VQKVYLDHAATTAQRPEVVEAMMPFFNQQYGNPSSLHQFGRWTRAAIEEARDRVAENIGAKSDEIFFTSGGTESNNMIVQGIGFHNFEKKGHFITSKIEHKAVLRPVQFLESLGFDATYLDVDEFGWIDPDDLRKAIRDDTLLISVMMANNEVGTIEPIEEMAKISHERGVPFHTDAIQCFGKIPVDIEKLGVDFLSLSGHKFYGPKGIGMCYVRESAKKLLSELILGGTHESHMRAGTENVPGIIGLAKAMDLAIEELDKGSAKLKKLSDMLYKGFLDHLDDVHLNGHPTNRLPGLVNLSFRGVEGESILLSLDMQGIAVSTGSACTSESLVSSHVLEAMGFEPLIMNSAVRFSLGRENTEEDIDYVLRVVPPVIERLRSVSVI